MPYCVLTQYGIPKGKLYIIYKNIMEEEGEETGGIQSPWFNIESGV